MRQTTMVHDLTEGSVSRKLLVFSVPFMLSNLLQVLYNLLDMVVVGRFVGSAGLSAVSNGGDITTLATMACVGLCSAGQIIIAQYVGAKHHEGIRKMIGTMFTFLLLLSVAVTLLGLALLEPMLSLLNVPPEAHAMAGAYVAICLWGMVFIFGYNLVSAILRGMGDSVRPLVIIAVAATLNLLLDLLMVGVFGMGAAGAAWATVISQGVSFLAVVGYLWRRREAFGFDMRWRSFRIDRASLGHLLRLGIPLALQSCAVMLSKLFINSYINAYGLVVSAVNGVGSKIGHTASVVTQGLGMAGTSMIGQNFGAGKPERIRKVVYASTLWGLVFTLLLSVVMILFPEQVFGLFDSNLEVRAMAHDYVLIAVLNFNAFAVRQPMMALVSGVGNATLAMVIGILDGVVARVGIAMLMGLAMGMGIMGFWYGNVIASYVPFVIGGIYFWSGMWQRRRPVAST